MNTSRLTASLLVFTAAGATAQETIAPDRPGIGSAATVILPGTVQLEAGAAFSSSGTTDAFSLGQLFVRYGVADWVELELLADSFVDRRDTGVAGGDSGLEDLALGAKARLLSDERATLSLQGLVTAPTGGNAFSSGAWYATVNGPFDLPLGERAGLGVNLGVRPAMSGLPTVVTANVTPGLALGGGYGVYGGWAGAFTDGAHTNYLEGGATRVLGADVQLDVNGARAVDTDDWFLGVGIAMQGGGG